MDHRCSNVEAQENTSENLDIEIRPATLEEILALRDEVIIQGTGRPSPEFDGDRESSTMHVGAFLHGRNVGCGTFLQNEWKGQPAWQLRGMATTPELRGKGIGTALLIRAEGLLRSRSPIRQMWCNARRAAVAFYVRRGWVIESEEFPTPGIGMQRRMSKRF